MTSIFLSYARGDDGEPFDPAASFVARLYSDLTAAGFDVWFDRVSMPSRTLTFHQEIRDAVAACDRLVLPDHCPTRYRFRPADGAIQFL